MNVIRTTPTGKPRCPNHGCELVGFGFPMKSKGNATCPISGATFAYEADVGEENLEETVNSSGEIIRAPKWKLTGND